MSTLAAKTLHTPDDLLMMPDGDRFELVNGNLVERNMGAWSSYVTGLVYAILQEYCRARRLGWVFPEGTSYQCFPDFPDKVRRADVSFIRLGRFSGERPPQGHLRVAPDVAVEVVSPNDLAYEVDEKVEEYVRAGVPLVWIVNPEARTVRVHRANGSVQLWRESDELTGGDVLSGFACRVEELFRTPSGAAVNV